MSRSTTIVSKPFKKTLKFKNEIFSKKLKKITQEAGFYYFEKSDVEGEKGKNILVPMPIKFLWLETAQSVSGFNEKEEKSVWSNEILPLNPKFSNILNVKIGDRVVETGKWKDIKESVKGIGGKFCAPMYVLGDIGDGMEIFKILLTGASSELAFARKESLLDNSIIFDDIEEVEMKTGTTYQKPVFRFEEITPEELELANKAVKEIDKYFEFILSQGKSLKEDPTDKLDPEDMDDELDATY